MEIVILFSLIGTIIILILIFQEIEKIVDNTFEIGHYLDRQEKREVKFARNLSKYCKRKEKK